MKLSKTDAPVTTGFNRSPPFCSTILAAATLYPPSSKDPVFPCDKETGNLISQADKRALGEAVKFLKVI